MDRRQYLGAAAAGVVVGVAGVVGNRVLTSGDNPEGPPRYESAAPYPPYPDTEPIKLSGEGSVASDSFVLENEGPTIIRADHEGDSTFVVKLQSMETSTIRDVVRLRGPYTGSTVVEPVEPGRYELFVSQTSASWTATVHDLPVYNESEMTLPVRYRGEQNTVIGPIKFGDRVKEDIKVINFSLTIDKNSNTTLSLVDSRGKTAARLIRKTKAGLKQTDQKTFNKRFPVAGIGYIAIDTNTTWTLSLEQGTEFEQSGNTTNESVSNTSQTNSTASTNQSTSANTSQTNVTTSTNQSTTINSTNQSN